ncbi:MAG: hypothetical protein ACHREM_04805 [Polyangiales bacterium]
MKLVERFEIKGRGYVFTTTVDGAPPVRGGRVRRPSDGMEWTVRGIEAFLQMRGRQVGDSIGLLLEGEPQPEIGDDIEAVLPAWATESALEGFAADLRLRFGLPEAEPSAAQVRAIAGMVESEISQQGKEPDDYRLHSITALVCSTTGQWRPGPPVNADARRIIAALRSTVLR